MTIAIFVDLLDILSVRPGLCFFSLQLSHPFIFYQPAGPESSQTGFVSEF